MSESTGRDGTRTSIVEAAAALLRDGGPAAVTTRAVAQAAGVQAPTIYRLFGDKDGLVDAVAEHVLAGWVATKAASAAHDDPDPVRALRTAWHDQIAFGLAHPGLHTLLSTPDRRASPATAAGIEVLRGRVRRVAAAGRLRVGEDRAVEMIHASGAGTVLALLTSPPAERDPGLADAMLDAVLAAVTTQDAPRGTPGPLPLTVGFAAVVPDLPGLRTTERALLADWVARAVDALQQDAPALPDEA